MFVLGLLQSTDCMRPKTRSKNCFEATLSNLKASFKKEARSAIEQKKTAIRVYIWFWVHWLTEHTPKSSKY